MRLTSPRWARAKRTLDVAFGDYKDTRRIHVINPSLCSDTIDLLRPSLPKPASCDIIDISPGPCIWSKALHEALQPRRHILVEHPGSKHYDAVTSLTSEPDSRYHTVTNVVKALELQNLSQTFQNYYQGLDDLQKRKVRNERTNELIITANLSGKNTITSKYNGPPWRLFLDQFYNAIASNPGVYNFHQYGLVRLLAWIPESEKDKIVPKTILRRSRLTKKLEASCSVREVVSSVTHTKAATLPQAWDDATMESLRRAAIRQRRNNLHIPSHRQHPLPQPSPRSFEPTPENFETLSTMPKRSKTVNDFIRLWHELEVLDGQWLENHVRLMEAERPYRMLRLPEEAIYGDFCYAYTRMRLFHKKYKEAQSMVNATTALEQEIISFRKQHPDDYEGYLQLVNDIKPKLDHLRAQIVESYRDTRVEVLKGIDDLRALNHDPPVLAWHRRPHEPLRSYPKDDFKPSREPLCLIELFPKPAFPNVINSADRQIIFTYISNCFDTAGVRLVSIQKILEDLVGEGELYDAFLKTVPSITDPLYGGWFDLSDIRTRNVTVEALIAITLAYEVWPYRISVMKMMKKNMGLTALSGSPLH